MERVRKIIHTEIPHKEGFFGSGTTVAILDTGIAQHTDFRGRILEFIDFVGNQTNAYDDNGHGTHLAGIIGGSGVFSRGKYMGIAPKCNFVICKVLDSIGNGDTKDALTAINWVLENKEKYNIRFLNISIGMMPRARRNEQKLLGDAIRMLWEADICVVVASGNNGPSRASVTVPGTIPEVITVGSLDDDDRSLINGTMNIGYSGRGPTDVCVSKPEILAPGTRIISCCHRGGYVAKSGTSMATAVVTGGLVLLGDIYPGMRPSDYKLFMYSKLKRRKDKIGWGSFDFADLL